MRRMMSWSWKIVQDNLFPTESRTLVIPVVNRFSVGYCIKDTPYLPFLRTVAWAIQVFFGGLRRNWIYFRWRWCGGLGAIDAFLMFSGSLYQVAITFTMSSMTKSKIPVWKNPRYSFSLYSFSLGCCTLIRGSLAQNCQNYGMTRFKFPAHEIISGNFGSYISQALWLCRKSLCVATIFKLHWHIVFAKMGFTELVVSFVQ